MNKRGKLGITSTSAKSSPSKTTQSSLSKYFGGTASKKDEEKDSKKVATVKVLNYMQNK